MKPPLASGLVLAALLATSALAGSGGIEALNEKYRGPDAAGASAEADIARAGDWAVYANPRFGTVVDYPPEVFTALPAPENGDGRAFEATDGRAGFVVWGGFNAMDDTAASRLGSYLETAGFDVIQDVSMIGAEGFRVVATRAGATVFHAEIIGGELIHGFEAEIAPGADPGLATVMRRMMESLRVADSSGTAPAAEYSVQDVATDTPERTILLDAAHAVIAPEIGRPIAFLIDGLRSYGPWAYLSAVPVEPDGQPLDWLQTNFADAWRGDMMSDTVMVFFHDDGSGWRVLDWVIGPTDVYWVGWMMDHDLPQGLFFSPDP